MVEQNYKIDLRNKTSEELIRNFMWRAPLDNRASARSAIQLENCILTRSGVVLKNGIPVRSSIYPGYRLRPLLLRAYGSRLFGSEPATGSTNISVINPYSNGYYHWMTECLPAYKYYHMTHGNDYKCWIAGGSALTDLQIETLRAVGIHNIGIIPVKRSQRFSKLVALSHNQYGRFSKSELSVLRDALKYDDAVEKKLLYVSRSDAKTRKIKNESDLITELKKIGFSIVTLTGKPFNEQVRLFNNTKFLLTIHGAALSNMLMMPQDSSVMEILQHPAQNKSSRYASLGRHHKLSSVYCSLATALDLQYSCMVSEPYASDTGEYNVNIDKVIQEINKWKAEQ